MIAFAVIFILFVALTIYVVLAKKRREKAMAEFAIQHGWTPVNDPSSLYQYLPQYLQGLGQNGYGFRGDFTRTINSFDMAYQANMNNIPSVFFQYTYTEYYFDYDPATNQQRETAESHSFTVVNASLSNMVPTILLLHHSFISKLATIGQHTGLQSVSLEGDFNKIFDTYITPNGQDEALSLLSPETMELVVSAGRNASIQLAGQALVFSSEVEPLNPSTIEPLLENIGKLVANINSKPQSELLPDSPAAGSQQ